MKELALSVIVCTYNRDKFIRDCLVGLLEQDASPEQFEVVLVNNNSTDRTEEIVQAFIKEHPDFPINYVVEKQQGLSYARNRGIEESQAALVTFIDDDAIPREDFVSGIVAFFANHQEATAVGGKVIATFETARPAWANRFSAGLYFSHYDKGNRLFRYTKGYPIGCNMSFRKSFFDQYINFNPDLGRKGKSGEGFEEKEIFATMRREDLPYYYDPNLSVLHQIDDERLSNPYQDKLAIGLGYSNHQMFCKEGTRWTCFRTLISIIAKYGAAVLLAIGYLFLGRPAVSRHLLRFRYLVLRGFLERLLN